HGKTSRAQIDNFECAIQIHSSSSRDIVHPLTGPAARIAAFYCFSRSYFRDSSTNRSIRAIASFSLSSPVAKQQRTKPSPEAPNALPGTTATFCDFNSRREKSLLFKPVEVTSGKT